MLRSQKRIAAGILKVGINRIWLDPTRLSDIKEAITKADIKGLISGSIIKALPVKGIGQFRVRKRKEQRRKGRRKGSGSRKGKATARLKRKRAWIERIRTQRKFLAELKDKKIIDKAVFRNLYLKSKGGFFRSKRHIKLYIGEHKLVAKNEKE